jgi:hypothetical protein
MVSRQEIFLFAPIGTYEVVAEKFQQGVLVFTSKEIIEVSNDGEFNIDIVMKQTPGVQIIPEKNLKPSTLVYLKAKYGNYWYLWALLIFVILIAILFLVHKLFFAKESRFGKKSISIPKKNKDKKEKEHKKEVNKKK